LEITLNMILHPKPLPRRLAELPPLVWLTLYAIIFVLVFYLGFTLRYSLAAFGDRPQATMATLSELTPESLLIYVTGFALLFGLYALGLGQVHRLAVTSKLAAGFLLIAGFAFNAVLLPMYTFDASDVFDYAIRGRITVNYGQNPLSVTPEQVAKDDPLYPFVAWKTIPGAYGPAWEWIAAATVRLAGEDRTATVYAFKLMAILGYLAAGVLIALTLRVLAPRRVLIGMYVWLWNPFVILMTGEGAHNDIVMVAVMLLGVYWLVRRWYIAATLAALVAAMIKFVPLALVAIIAVVALRDLPVRKKLRYVMLSGVLGMALFVAIAAPFWTGRIEDVLSLDRRSRMYTGSVAAVIRQTLIPTLDEQAPTAGGSLTPNTNALISRTSFALLAIFGLWQLYTVWRDRDPLRPIRALTLILLFYLLVSSFWFMGWYVVWAVALAALLDYSPLRRFITLFSYLVTWEMVTYQYITLRPGAWAPLPWRDGLPVLVYMGGAWLWIGWYWLRRWWLIGMRSVEAVRRGAQLRQAREAAELTVIGVTDDLGWRTDDLIAYEAGMRSISEEDAATLEQHY
jgi:hypothetical protein